MTNEIIITKKDRHANTCLLCGSENDVISVTITRDYCGERDNVLSICVCRDCRLRWGAELINTTLNKD